MSMTVEKAQALEAFTLTCNDAERVRVALEQKGLETPLKPSTLSRDEKYELLKASFSDIAKVLGLDLEDDSLVETPHRIAKMYLDEVFSGLDYGNFPKISVIDNKMGAEEMVKIDDISVISTCEHHFVTIDGHARVAYIPNDKIIGLSKINRIVRFFAQRPQVQERLTRQIQVSLQTLLDTEDVAVKINAMHYCVKARGVMDAGSKTETSALGGAFRKDALVRGQFLS